MADTITANYSWIKPEVGGSTSSWGGKLNADLDGIDAQVFAATTTANSAQTNSANAQTTATAAQNTANQALTLAQNPPAPTNVLLLSGGTMLGLLTLAGQGTGTNDAATKGYVDSKVSGGTGAYLPLTGGTITGALTVQGTATFQGTTSCQAITTTGVTSSGGVVINAGNPQGIAIGKSTYGSITGAASMSFNPGVGLISESSVCSFYGNKIGANGPVFNCYQAGTLCGSITVSGSSSTAYNTSSDARLKEDEKEFEAGPIIDQLKVYDFAWIVTKSRGHGVIAQEAESVYPEAVTYDEDRDWWGVDYSKFVPLLLREIQALRWRLAALEARTL